MKDLYRKIKSRFYILKYHLRKVSSPIYFGGNSSISEDLETEPYVFIGKNCIIYPKVKIGAYSMLANNVSIMGDDHNFNFAGKPMIFSGRPVLNPTTIERDVWIGAFSIIKTGVTIGEGTIVAAGSVVTKSLEPYSIYGGVPVKKIRNRFPNDQDLKIHKEFLQNNPYEFDKDLVKICNRIG